MKKSAFTLLELLIVITIIGVLTSVLVLDFVGVKQRQELSLMADQSVAMLQQARGEVGAGKIRGGIFLCEGAFFEKGEAPLFAIADYDVASESCSNFETEFYGLSTGGAFVSTITVGDIETESVWALYSPPEGKVIFFSDETGATEVLSGDGIVHFGHGTAVDLDLSIEISSITNLVTLSLGTNEE
ncbi:MAG: prepilin-type N-terminal cleavage/methylation domain-containing protein [Candidatus Gracilibacteria bacterium]